MSIADKPNNVGYTRLFAPDYISNSLQSLVAYHRKHLGLPTYPTRGYYISGRLGYFSINYSVDSLQLINEEDGLANSYL